MSFAKCFVCILVFSLAVASLTSDPFAAMRRAAPSGSMSEVDYAVPQIGSGPVIGRKGHSVGKTARELIGGSPRRKKERAGRASKTLVDALIEPASEANSELLSEFGLPLVEGVPPFAVLFPPSRDAVGRLRSQATQ